MVDAIEKGGFLPPYKEIEKFKCALKQNAKVEDGSWKLFPLNRIFFNVVIVLKIYKLVSINNARTPLVI